MRRNAKHVVVASALFMALLTGADGADQDNQESLEQQRAEKRFTMTFETTGGTNFCQAKTSIEYQQRSEIVRVSGEVLITDCVSATGEYTISIRTRNENGELQNSEHREIWSRSDTTPIGFTHDYAIGKNVDLVRVRARRTRCICNEAEAEAEK